MSLNTDSTCASDAVLRKLSKNNIRISCRITLKNSGWKNRIDLPGGCGPVHDPQAAAPELGGDFVMGKCFANHRDAVEDGLKIRGTGRKCNSETPTRIRGHRMNPGRDADTPDTAVSLTPSFTFEL